MCIRDREVTRDIEKEYLPFNSCSVDHIDAESVLEHVVELWHVLDECHRVLKEDGTLFIETPNGVNIAPDHVRYFNDKFFKKYITRGPDMYDFTDKKWKLLEYEAGNIIRAKLKPIKKNSKVVGHKINIGCGSIHKPGYINADIVQPADIIVDVTKGMPFTSNRFEEVYADNLMEHLDNESFMRAMNDIHRVLQKDGVFTFKVPNALDWADGAYGDPTHKRFFVPRSFRYFTNTETYHNYGKSYGFKMFEQVDLKNDNKFFIWTGRKS